jgi:hypothetical protein
VSADVRVGPDDLELTDVAGPLLIVRVEVCVVDGQSADRRWLSASRAVPETLSSVTPLASSWSSRRGRTAADIALHAVVSLTPLRDQIGERANALMCAPLFAIDASSALDI